MIEKTINAVKDGYLWFIEATVEHPHAVVWLLVSLAIVSHLVFL